MTTATTLPFSPSSEPLGSHGAPDCCQGASAEVIVRRQNTLGQRLPIISPGKLEQDSGAEYSGTVEPDHTQNPEQQLARFRELSPGRFQWLSPDYAEGEHLIGVNTISQERRFAPGSALNEGVELTAVDGKREVTAIHLPPPVVINLRQDTDPEQDLLTLAQLDYFRANGNNALVFVHGYNVPHGDWGRFLKGEDRIPDWHGNGRSFRQIPRWHPQKATVWQDAEALSASIDTADVHGSGVHDWAVNMEYRLNEAAGFDGENWMPFSRIINISWPGDTGSTDFMQAELNAMAAGRRMVPLLQQLQDAGIAVNLITHSLGARVALTALNILGILGKQNLLDHLFLWQPAVADNALTNDASRDSHPLGLGVFPYAYKAAKQIVVLHSKNDGILGPASPTDENWWQALVRHASPVSAAIRDIVASNDAMDEFLGYVHGAYDKKWWTFPSFLDNGFGPAIESLYSDYLPLAFNAEQADRARRGYPLQQLRQQALGNWQRLEQDILAEAQSLRQHCIDCLRNGERPPKYMLLAPLNHRASISMEAAQEYVERLKALALNNWRPENAPRPALGYVGFEGVAKDQDSPQFDPFISRNFDQGKFLVLDQTGWLLSHSGMKIPSDEVFEKSYTDAIMKPIVREGAGFGRYK